MWLAHFTVVALPLLLIPTAALLACARWGMAGLSHGLPDDVKALVPEFTATERHRGTIFSAIFLIALILAVFATLKYLMGDALSDAILWIVIAPIFVTYLIGEAAIVAQRAHDIGYSTAFGVALCMGMFVPYFGVIVVLYLCLAKGQAAANAYGSPEAPQQ